MPPQKKVRVLTVQASCLSYPQICEEFLKPDAEVCPEAPFCIASFPVTLDQTTGKMGSLAGVLVVYILPEVAAVIYAAVVGTTHSYGDRFSPLLPYYYDTSFTRKSVEFIHVQQVTKDDSWFAWPCFCFCGQTVPLSTLHHMFRSQDGEDSALINGRAIFYAIKPIYSFDQAIHSIQLKPTPKVCIENCIPTVKLSISLLNKSAQPLKLVPLPVLISLYQQWLVHVFSIPMAGGLHVDSPKSYISIDSDDTSSSADCPAATQSTERIRQMFVTRFCPTPILCTEDRHIGNEVFVFFPPVNEAHQRLHYIRQACVFPGKGLTNEETGIGVTIGSFYVYERLRHSVGVASLGFEHYESDGNGIITYLGLGLTVPPYTGVTAPAAKCLVVAHVYVAPDSEPAISASVANYKHLRCNTVKQPFTYMSTIFSMPFALRNQLSSTEPGLFHTSRITEQSCVLELHRPLYGACSGGCFFVFSLPKATRTVSVVLPSFTSRLQSPEKTFPQHRSQLTYYPLFSTGYVTGYSALPFATGEVHISTHTRSNITVTPFTFPLECMESVTYKQHDRLIFSAVLHHILPWTFSMHCLDFSATCIPSNLGAPGSQPYGECAIYRLSYYRHGQLRQLVRKRVKDSKKYGEDLPIPGSSTHITQIGNRLIHQGEALTASVHQLDYTGKLLSDHFSIRPGACPYTRTSPNYYNLILDSIFSQITYVAAEEYEQHKLQRFLEAYAQTVTPEAEFRRGAISMDTVRYLLSLHTFKLNDDYTMCIYSTKP